MISKETYGFHAVIFVPKAYRQSRELDRCVRRLQYQLGSKAVWCDDVDEWRSAALIKAATGLPVLLVREPGFIGVAGWVDALASVLASLKETDAVMPADPLLAKLEPAPAYYTMRGYEHYVANRSVNCGKITLAGGDGAYVVLARETAVKAVLSESYGIDDAFAAWERRAKLVFDGYLQPFFRYFDSTREDMLPMVPDGICRALDVGCAHGAFGALLKATYGCAVDGVEAVNEVANQAGERLDNVFFGDFLQTALPGDYDLISFLDVLEHFPDPAAVLDKTRRLLAPRGKILLSIPNVGFWAIVDDLLGGRWDYVPAGILCETHLRFFTAATLSDLLNECGFRVIREDPQKIPMPEEVAARLGAIGNLDSLTTYSFRVLAEFRD